MALDMEDLPQPQFHPEFYFLISVIHFIKNESSLLIEMKLKLILGVSLQLTLEGSTICQTDGIM